MVRFYLLLFLMILLFSGCKENLEFPGEQDFPVVFLENPKDINIDGVTLEGRLVMKQLPNHPAISYGFIIDEKTFDIDTVIVGQADSPIHFTYRYENLSINDRSIEIQAFGKDEHNTYLSNRRTIDLIGASHEINGFNPGEGIKGDTLVIMGYRFSSERNPVIKINENIAPILSINSDSIVIQVPASMGYEAGVLSVTLDNHEVMATDTFKYQKPVILELSPYLAWENDTIVIMGENFSNDAEVLVGDRSQSIIYYSRNSLMVHLTDSPLRTEEAIVINSDNFTASSDPFFLVSPWKQIRNFPYSMWDGIGFAINTKGYAGRTRFYQYNPNTDLWIQKSDIPSSTLNTGAFVIDNRGFVLRTHQWWPEGYLYEYLPEENEWVQKTSFPSKSWRISTLEVNNNVFTYGGDKDNTDAPNFFQYSPSSDSWSQTADLPAPAIFKAITFSTENYGYLGTGIDHLSNTYTNTFYRYDLWNDSWTEISDFPISIANGIGFSINNTGYAGLGTTGQNENRHIYAYDPILDAWKWMASYPSIFTRGCTVFTIAEKAYIGTGTDQPNPGGYPSPDNAFYEFDPQYLKENYQQK